MMLAAGQRVRTPLGAGTVVYVRMAPPTYTDVEAASVRLDAVNRPGYAGTTFRASDCRPEKESEKC